MVKLFFRAISMLVSKFNGSSAYRKLGIKKDVINENKANMRILFFILLHPHQKYFRNKIFFGAQ
jgi:hypothetical protein